MKSRGLSAKSLKPGKHSIEDMVQHTVPSSTIAYTSYSQHRPTTPKNHPYTTLYLSRKAPSSSNSRIHPFRVKFRRRLKQSYVFLRRCLPRGLRIPSLSCPPPRLGPGLSVRLSLELLIYFHCFLTRSFTLVPGCLKFSNRADTKG